MAISGVATSGLISGLDVNGLISQMIAYEQRPISLLQSRQTDYSVKIASVLNLSSKLSSYKSALDSLNDSEKFNTKSASVTTTTNGDNLLSVSTSSEAADGSYEINVNQLATASKKASQGWIDQNLTEIASAVGSFSFKVGISGAVTTLGVDSTTTLQGLRDKINNADAGVTATIIDDGTGSTSYRLILTADDMGSSNTIYIPDNDTNLDFTNKKIEDAYAYSENTYSGTVYSNSGNYYTGTENKTYLTKITTAGTSGTAKYKWSDDGGINWSSEVTTASISNTISQFEISSGATANNTIIFNDGSERTATLSDGTYTADALAAEIKSAMETANGSADTYTVTYSATTGKFTIENDAGNTNDITINWSNTGSNAAGILGFDDVDTVVAKGSSDVSDFIGGMFVDGAGIANSTNGGVKVVFGATGTLEVGDQFSTDVFNPEMQTAKDAVIEIDNATIVKSTNTIDDAIEGVTMNLLKADASETLTLTVSSSSKSAKSSIEDFVDSYNELYAFINEQMSYDPETEKVNPLLGDPTVLEIRRRIADGVTGTIPGLSTASYTNLSHIGITSNYETGKLSIDSSKLSSALGSKPDDVARLFIGMATPSDSAVTYEGKTSATQAGTYGVSISTAPEKAIINGDNDLSSTGLAADEILTFKYSTNYTDTDATFTSFSVTLASGSKINAIVNTLNSGFATNNAPLTAYNNSGVLKVTSDDYGEDIWLQVRTEEQGDGYIWDDSDSEVGETKSDVGVDIAGSINNHVANGVGNILTAASGFAEEGLQISTTSNQTGLFGTINVSLGITDLLPSIIDSYVDSDTGVLKLKQDSMQDSIDDIADRIIIMQKRIEDKQERLRQEFTRLEMLLSKYDSLAQYMTNTLTALPKIGG